MCVFVFYLRLCLCFFVDVRVSCFLVVVCGINVACCVWSCGCVVCFVLCNLGVFTVVLVLFVWLIVLGWVCVCVCFDVVLVLLCVV